jgi:hypothetical protein
MADCIHRWARFGTEWRTTQPISAQEFRKILANIWQARRRIVGDVRRLRTNVRIDSAAES